MDLQLSGRGPLVGQVHRALRERIESGALPGGTRLPGSRHLARLLGVSRGTVVAAYERLEAEGYCRPRPRSGTRVADIFPAAATVPGDDAARSPPPAHPIRWRAEQPELIWDLRLGLPNPADFPHGVWSRLVRRALRERGSDAFDYPHPEGLPRLRAAVAAHLRRQRGLPCTADRVLITHGAQQAFGLIARALLPGGSRVAVEEPGYRGFGQVVRAAGIGISPTPVDDRGLVVTELDSAGVGGVYVTPAHQFPSGVILSAARRRALLAWARAHDAWIIEDDYDSAYRFDAPPLPPLQQLDRDGRVLLVGSFSKTVFPGLRLGYVVAEQECLELLALMKNLEDAGSPGLYQAALADFIEEGHYHRHLRRSLRRNAARRRALVEALRARFGNGVRILGAESGLHLVADLGLTPGQERTVVRLARRRGLGLYGQSSFTQGDRPVTGLVLGYARLDAGAPGEAVSVLGRVVDEVRQ